MHVHLPIYTNHKYYLNFQMLNNPKLKQKFEKIRCKTFIGSAVKYIAFSNYSFFKNHYILNHTFIFLNKV